MEKLVLGIAYHGNRMLSHVEKDMEDIVNHGFNTVVHMYSHMDMDRTGVSLMKEIVEISKKKGLDVWVDNWGLAGRPGDPSHFLSSHRDCHQVYNDGTYVDPSNGGVMACYNQSEFIEFTKKWIDDVKTMGASTIFWDEPVILGGELDENGYQKLWACRCPVCQKLFKEKYGYEMPVDMNEDTKQFRMDTIVNYLTVASAYAKDLGLKNVTCVDKQERHGMCLKNIELIAGLPSMDNVGSDPYLSGPIGYSAGYKKVYAATKYILDVCARNGKEHNVWIKSYGGNAIEQENIISAADAAYDAGARQIFYWSYRGAESCWYKSVNPDLTWYLTGEANRRILDKYYNECREEAQK